VLHVDETTTRIGTTRRWLHVACTTTLTLLGLGDRSRDGANALGLSVVATSSAIPARDSLSSTAHSVSVRSEGYAGFRPRHRHPGEAQSLAFTDVGVKTDNHGLLAAELHRQHLSYREPAPVHGLTTRR